MVDIFRCISSCSWLVPATESSQALWSFWYLAWCSMQVQCISMFCLSSFLNLLHNCGMGCWWWAGREILRLSRGRTDGRFFLASFLPSLADTRNMIVATGTDAGGRDANTRNMIVALCNWHWRGMQYFSHFKLLPHWGNDTEKYDSCSEYIALALTRRKDGTSQNCKTGLPTSHISNFSPLWRWHQNDGDNTDTAEKWHWLETFSYI